MKWLDFSDLGLHLQQAYRKGRHWLILNHHGRQPADLFVEERLARGGFKPFPNGWYAPLSAGTTQFLKRFPGARPTVIRESDLETFFYGDVPEWLREKVRQRVRSSIEGQENKREKNDDREDAAVRTVRHDGADALESASAGAVPDTGTPGDSGRSDPPGGATDERASGGDSGKDHAAGVRAGSGSSGQDRGDGPEAGGGGRSAGPDPSGSGDGHSDGNRGGRYEASGRERDGKRANPGHFFFTDEQQRTAGFSPSQRLNDNLDAIACLNRLEEESRPPTDEERSILARYCGWGGLAGVFSPNRSKREPWQVSGEERLRTLVSDSVFEAISKTVSDSYYTPPGLVRTLWAGAGAAGFSGGRVLDPAAGAGTFPGHAPEHLVRASRFACVEVDPVAAKVLRHLFPEASVQDAGFESLQVPNGYFDLVMTNVPFGDYSVADPDYDKHKLQIHDYFAVKALDKTRPGGLVILITSTGTLDKSKEEARRLLARRGRLIGALRLPHGTFSAQAGTEAGADILVFQKHEREPGADLKEPDWIESRTMRIEGEYSWESAVESVNAYFHDHPEHVLGTMVADRGEHYRRIIKVVPEDGVVGDALWERARDALQAMIAADQAQSATEEMDASSTEETEEDEIDVDLKAEDEAGASIYSLSGEVFVSPRLERDSFVLDGDRVVVMTGYRDENGREMVRPVEGMKGKRLERLKGQIRIRDAMNEVFETQIRSGVSDSPEYLAARERLNQVYDAFVEKYGNLTDPANRRVFLSDPESGRVAALERVDPETGNVTKSDIFSRRILGSRPPEASPSTPVEALAVSLNARGRVDPRFIGECLNADPDAVMETLASEGRVFEDPVTRDWVLRDVYLSGNVREKLNAARQAAAMEPGMYARNIEALEAVIPEDILPGDISVKLGAPWVPGDVVESFMRDLLLDDRFDETHWIYQSFKAKFVEAAASWDIDAPEYQLDRVKNLNEWGTERRPAIDLIKRACNNQEITVYDRVYDAEAERDKQVKNHEETIAAQEKLDALNRRFREYLWEDPERADRLIRIYNDRYNCWRTPSFDGSHLTFPGMSDAITMRSVQSDVVWRALLDHRVLLAHDVGVGKTYEQIAIAMEARRLGLCRKPLQVIPNHMLEQFEREARELYPDAKILVVGENEFKRQNRKTFMGKIANNEWDLVITTHAQFKKLRLDPEFVERFVASAQADLEMAASQVSSGGYTSKRLARAKKRIETQLKRIAESSAKDDGLTLSDLGIDWLQIDESHNFKNLDFGKVPANLESTINGSQQALDLYMKMQWLYEQRGEHGGVVFASGTPVSNHILETFVLQQYLQEDVLRKMGIYSVDAWANSFLEPVVQWEPDPGGTGYKQRTRYRLVNAPEIMGALLQVMDVKSSEDAGIVLPEMETVQRTVDMDASQRTYMQLLAKRVEAIREGDVDPRDDNILKIISEGRKLGLDMRLLLQEGDEPSAKIQSLIEAVVDEHREHDAQRGTQLIFCEQGTPGGVSYNIYQSIKDELVDAGIPADQIAFIHDYKTDAAKAKLFAAVREGQIRVVLGSTRKMGEGTNMQTRLTAIHHLDPPWRPSDIRQRDGRGRRFGNMNSSIRRYIYATRDSFDLFMWNLMKVKEEQFSRIMRGDASIRVFDEEVDPTFAETTAIVTGDPLLREKIENDQEVSKLSALERSWQNGRHALRRHLERNRHEIESLESRIRMFEVIRERNDQSGLWRIDLLPYGMDSRFEGSRKKLLPLLSKLIVSQQLETIEGLTFNGLPVVVDIAKVKKKGRGVVHESTYSLCVDGRSIGFGKAHLLEADVKDADAIIDGARARIGHLSRESDGIESRLENNAEFEHKDALAKALIRQSEIAAEIVRRDTERRASGESDDGDTSPMMPPPPSRGATSGASAQVLQ